MQAPKKRTSRSKRNMRRSHHALSATTRGSCPQCGEPVLPHHVCLACGYYRGRQIVQVETE